MPWVREIDDLPIEQKILLDRKLAVQKQTIMDTDWNRTITQFAEIKPLTQLNKPIMDSLGGLFQNPKNFVFDKNGNVIFSNEGLLAFVEDLSNKGIRSSDAIAQYLADVAMNAPSVPQPRANYSRELAKAFSSLFIDEMTKDEIIMIAYPESRERFVQQRRQELGSFDETSIDRATDVGTPRSDDTPRPAKGERDEEGDSLFIAVGNEESSVPGNAYKEIDDGIATDQSFDQIFDKYWGTFKEPRTVPEESKRDPFRIYMDRDYIFLLGDVIRREDFKDGMIKLYGREVPLSDELLRVLKNTAGDLQGYIPQDPNTGAILAWAYRNNPTAFEQKNNSIKRKFIEAPYKDKIDPIFGTGLKGKGKGKVDGAGMGKTHTRPSGRGGSGSGSATTKPTRPKANPVYVLSVKELQDKFKTTLGLYKAGNHSKATVQELKALSDALYKNKKLSKESNMKIQKL